MMPLRRTRTEDCVSDLRFDMLVSGELDGETQRGVRAHLEHCGLCADRLRSIEADHAQFHPEPRLRRARRWSRIAAPIGVALAAAAALVMFVTPKHEPSGTRTKGAARLGLFIERDGQLQPGTTGDVVQPGDVLQFTVTTTRPTFVALVGVDGSRHADVYFSETGVAGTIGVGEDIPLPVSIRLDEVPGVETFHALFCDHAVSLAPIVAALPASPAALAAPRGCEVETIALEKRP